MHSPISDLDIEAQILPNKSLRSGSGTALTPIDLTAKDHPSLLTRFSESCSSSLGYVWHNITYYIDYAFDGLESYIERKYGGKISTEDSAALLLLTLSLFEGAFSSRVWISARAEFFISAIISVFTLMNDRRNFILKAREKARLQREFVRVLQKTSILVKAVQVRGRSSGKYTQLYSEEIPYLLERYWDSCSHMSVTMLDGSSYMLHNLYNIRNRYAQFNSLGIILSWCCVLINITFNLIKIFYPISYLADGFLYGAADNFTAEVVIDVSNVFSAMPLNGNYTFTKDCVDNGTFTGFVDVPYSPLSDPYARQADHAFTVLSGVPFRTICSWIIVLIIQQQITIRNACKKIAESLRLDYIGAVDARRMAIAIPDELPKILTGTKQIELGLIISKLERVIAEYNAQLAQDNTFYEGMVQAGQTFANGISAANDSRRQKLLATKNRLEANIRVMRQAQQAVEVSSPELALEINEACKLAVEHAQDLEDECSEQERRSNETVEMIEDDTPALFNQGQRTLLFGQPVSMQRNTADRGHLVNLHRRYPDSEIFQNASSPQGGKL